MSSKLEYKRAKPVPDYKVKKVKELVEKLSKYKSLILFDFRDIPANLMKEVRKKMWNRGELIVIKNNLARIAIDEKSKGDPKIAKLKDYLVDMRALFLTNENIFDVARELASIRLKLPPKPGKVSPIDIIIPRMNTGYKTGPLLTDFRLAGLPIKMIEGEIWIWEETHFVKKGQKLNAQAAKILQLLDISPFEVGPEVIVGYDDGEIIERDVLLKPLEEYLTMIEQAYTHVYNLAMNLMIPIPELIDQQLQLAIMRAINVAVEANIFTEETAEVLIAKALNIAIGTAIEIQNIDPNALSDELKEKLKKTREEKISKIEEKEEEKEEKKEEKKEEEEEGVSGLATLFG